MELAEERLIAGSGASARRYWRGQLPDGRTAVRCQGTVAAENRAFLAHTRAFLAAGLPVARVLDTDPGGMGYILDDLGDDTLCSLAAAGRPVAPMADAALRMLPRFQLCRGIDWGVCYPVAEMDATAIGWDLSYFKYCYLLAVGATVDEPALQADFDRLAAAVAAQPLRGFMMRDFQGRNIMFPPGEPDRPYFIDYQGGRLGPLLYDAASLLWQARLGLGDDERRERFATYLAALRQAGAAIPDDVGRQLHEAALLRVLQTLGAYGLRGLVERKPAFIAPIARALANAQELTDQLAAYPAIAAALRSAAARLAPQEADGDGRLTVRVASFGFRKSGIPADPSGNGGGFVYDCRALPNPGRLPQFRRLTGRDPEVIDWLDATGQMPPFLDAAWTQVGRAVDNYLERGFSSLMVSFGCTGGQHRSVYCAEHMAERLRRAYPQVNVVVTHTEQQ